MRMLFEIFSWLISSTERNCIIKSHVNNTMINTTPCQPESPTGLSVKRKRYTSEETDSSLEFTTHYSKRRKEMLCLRSPISPIEPIADHRNPQIKMMDTRILSSTIESQFSLEILLKHNELRLIDQELAKCQIALEQLRRCHLIPYPFNSVSSVSNRLNVIDGTGPALTRAKETPPCASPFGVTDGPYTRHYAKWLIPDPIFDGDSWVETSESRASENITEVRATRHSLAENTTKIGKPNLRGNTGQKLQALANGYPQVKEKAGPCVIRRIDGQTVKLVCLDCHRENFSSTQGFINHCRIAHRRDFKSHEEATTASGKVIYPDEMNGNVKCHRGERGGGGNFPITSISNGLVHPLVRSALTGKEARDACKALLSRVADSKAMLREGRLPGFTSIPQSEGPQPDASKSSTYTSKIPHLAELWNHKGCSGDMNEILEEVQLDIDSEHESSNEEGGNDENIDDNSQILPNPEVPINCDRHRSPLTPQPRMPETSSRPFPSSPISTNTQPILPGEQSDHSYYLNSSFSSPSAHCKSIKIGPGPTTSLPRLRKPSPGTVSIRIMNGPSINDLSPETATSNNAPSLVSDDGEYDEDIMDSSRSEDEADESDVAEIDIAEDLGSQTELGARQSTRRHGRLLKREEKVGKQVTFVRSIKDKTEKRRIQFHRP